MNERITYIWLQQALGFYNRLAHDIFNRFGSIREIYECEDFSFLGEKREKYIKRLESKDLSSAYEVAKRCESIGVQTIGFYSELYPKKLKDIENPPVALHALGTIKQLDKIPCIAIVGTRNMTEYGKSVTENFAYNFAKSGACVVSGLAKGVDTAAHRGTIKAGGYTVAVLGNPIGDVYPKENIKAFETLYRRGLVVSELYPGAPRTRADFPNRNRIISGISDDVVISEAGENSGALITARHAIAQGKAIYAIPGAVGAESAGVNLLIKQGVPAVTEPSEVIAPLLLEFPEQASLYSPLATERLGSYGNTSCGSAESRSENEKAKEKKEIKPKKTDNSNQAPLPFTEQAELEAPQVRSESEGERFSDPVRAERILAVLKGRKALSPDEILIKTGLSINEVLVELTFMEIDGLVIATAGGRFISAKF
ncbi:MAG: DNA-processing protein DprA [Clostridia bacterium]|nr:DNA-processing protein DprA [Clostridia bacterium]